MGEYWDQETRQWRDEDTGRPREEQREHERAFERGREKAKERFREIMSGSWAPPASAVTDGLPGFDYLRPLPPGDRGTWMRNSTAGRLAAVMQPDDPAEPANERQAAKEFIDNHEYTYGRRPSMTEARLAVGRRSDGVVLDGEDQIRAAFRQAGIGIAFVDEVKPLPQGAAAVTQQPVRRG